MVRETRTTAKKNNNFIYKQLSLHKEQTVQMCHPPAKVLYGGQVQPKLYTYSKAGLTKISNTLYLSHLSPPIQ